MTKRRRQGWMLFLAGLLLLAGAWLLLRLLPGLDTTPWRAVPRLRMYTASLQMQRSR